jgi:hypothetical protein
MNKQELIKIADSLGLEHYNENDKFICVKGINGHASVLYTDTPGTDWNFPAIMEDFVNHIKMMGRDSLRMELHSMLSITSHQ